MTVEQIIDQVDNISSKTNYWFIRTNYGEYFNEFTENGYIAIGWDYFTLDEIINRDVNYIKNKIASHEKFNPEKSQDKMKITSSYNKIKTFINLKKGDVVVVPSKNSDRLAFGKVTDDKPYQENNLIGTGTHFKRRKIDWIEIRNIRTLHPIFYQVKSNQHAVSQIDRFAPHIDKVMGNLYKKNNNTHYILNIEKDENINFDELTNLMANIKDLMTSINEELSLNDNLEDFYIKINLQSRGAIELIKAGKSLAILAYLLSLVSCGTIDNAEDNRIREIINKNRKILEKTSKDIEALEINTNDLNKPFENGN